MNERVIEARNDAQKREIFIRDNEQTILRIASKACGKYITTSDDEWSVALFAFNKSIDTYQDGKGDFLPYAGVVIKRALIDYYRTEKKHDPELPVSHEMLTGEGDYGENSEVLRAVSRDSLEAEERSENRLSIKEEIIEVNECLKKYGFTFRDLKDSSPKAGKTKAECAKAIAFIMDNAEVLDAVISTGRLPIKEITEAVRVSRKIFDRYRRYVIMAVVILNGEYPLLADYLQYIRKSGKEGSG